MLFVLAGQYGLPAAQSNPYKPFHHNICFANQQRSPLTGLNSDELRTGLSRPKEMHGVLFRLNVSFYV